jgi:alpha-L-fucosidase
MKNAARMVIAAQWSESAAPSRTDVNHDGRLTCEEFMANQPDPEAAAKRWETFDTNKDGFLSREALVEIYYLSVGHGVNLLLNATPDSHGEVPAAQMKRLQGFGDEIRARFAKPLFTTKGQGHNLALDFGGEKTIDHMVLREDIPGGERVRKFLIEGRRANGKWLALARGTQVGSRQIIPIPATAVTGLRLTVQESLAPVTIRELSVFHVNRPVPPLAYREGGGPTR